MIAMVDLIPAILTGVAAVMASVSAILSARGGKHAKEANDAVITGTPRIYDLVLENHATGKEMIEWKRGYEGGPLDSGTKVENFMTEFEELKDSLRCKHPEPPCEKP